MKNILSTGIEQFSKDEHSDENYKIFVPAMITNKILVGKNKEISSLTSSYHNK